MNPTRAGEAARESTEIQIVAGGAREESGLEGPSWKIGVWLSKEKARAGHPCTETASSAGIPEHNVGAQSGHTAPCSSSE